MEGCIEFMRKPTVHDHFDGTNHCIECQGPCQLEGADYYLSQVILCVIESDSMSIALRGLLEDAGVQVEYFIARARGEFLNAR